MIVNTTDISVTNDGLILNDPGNTFSDGTSIVCTFNQPGIDEQCLVPLLLNISVRMNVEKYRNGLLNNFVTIHKRSSLGSCTCIYHCDNNKPCQ